MSLNQVVIVGNLGRDPEVRTAQSGTVIAKLNVATSSRVKKGDNWEDHTEWHRVVVFGKQAEHCEKYLSKGRTVAVTGELRTNKWHDDKAGIDRWSTEIIARDVKFLGGKSDGDSRSSSRGSVPMSGGDFGADEDVPY